MALLTVILAFSTAAADEEYRGKRRVIEVRFAAKLMKIAKAARRYRSEELCRTAFEHAEDLDPGNDDALDFDPTVTRPQLPSDQKKIENLEREYRSLRLAEAKARLELARWCDDEAFVTEAAREAAAALRLAPGPVAFDAEGVLSAPGLRELPKSLSLAVLEEHDVYRGRLLAKDDIPTDIPWAKGWELATEHYVIRTNVSAAICRETGRALEAAREIYRRESGFEVGAKITVHVLAERRAYEELWIAMGRPRPEPSNIGRCVRDFCGVDGSKPVDEVISVAIHECAHGYYNLGHEAESGERGVSMPPWYAEGFATYCAGYGPGSLSYERGVVVPEIAREKPLARFRKMLERGEAIPMGDFLSIEAGDSAFYLQAYAFFWFLHEGEDADMKERLGRTVMKLRRAAITTDRVETALSIFTAEFGGDLSDLEQAFFAWAQGSGSEADSAPITTR